MKLCVLLFAVSALGCPRPSSQCDGGCPPLPPEDFGSDASISDIQAACQRAGDHLRELGCDEARGDFAQFCVDEELDNIDLHPDCIATIRTCEELDTRCR